MKEAGGPPYWTRRSVLKGLGATGVLLGAEPLWQFGMGQSSRVPQPGPADWPRFGYDLQNTRFNAKEKILGVENVGRLKLKWSAVSDGVIQTTPTVIGDTLFFGTQSGYEYAIETHTGERKWKL